MNLKRRLILANAATVVIPIVITVIIALAFIFVSGKLSKNDISLANYQRVSQIKLELVNSENSVLKRSSEAVEEPDFQKQLQQRLAAVGGELIIVKSGKVIFASRDFSKIDVAASLEAGNSAWGSEPVAIGNISYSVQDVKLNFKDGSTGDVLLLAQMDRSPFLSFLAVVGISFLLAFVVTNMLVSYYLSRSMVKPLENLQQAAAEISCGNLDYQIVEDGDHEIQALCRDLETMRIKLKDSIHTQLKYEDNRKMLVSSISHDLKTPVTSIKGYVEGIVDGVASTPEKMARYLNTIYAKAQQLDQMIDDLLLYAKLDLNQIPFNFERTNVVAYLKACLAECEPELEIGGIKLDFFNELSRDYTVQLDRERMKRVIVNILDNSRKYMDKAQGEISVQLRETNSSIIIEFRDNGSGVKDSDLPHIFDRFFRSDQARSGIKGSGLGLAIAKQIVEGHQGKVWAVGHGTGGTSIMISLGK